MNFTIIIDTCCKKTKKHSNFKYSPELRVALTEFAFWVKVTKRRKNPKSDRDMIKSNIYRRK